MTQLTKASQESGGAGSGIAYFFEKGDENQAELIRFIDWVVEVSSEPTLRYVYDYYSHTVVRKGEMRLLEGADILAWEWAKERARSADGKRRRPSLEVLLNSTKNGEWKERAFASIRRRALHLDAATLDYYYNNIEQHVLS